MELSCSNIKKILKEKQGKLLLYFEKWNLFIFPKTEPCTSQTEPKRTKKNPLEKNSLYFWKWKFLALILKKLLYFRPQPSKFFHKKTRSEKIIFSQKKAFLIFPEMKPCTFNPKPGKLKKSTPGKFLTLPEKNFLYFPKGKLFLYFRKQRLRKNFLHLRK